MPYTPIRDMEMGYHLNFRDPDNIALELSAPRRDRRFQGRRPWPRAALRSAGDRMLSAQDWAVRLRTVSTADRTQRLLTLAAAVGQTALPILLSPRFDPDDQPPDVLSSVPITFSVWVPIFATSLPHAGFQALPSRAGEPLLRAVSGPATDAYAATAIWAPLVRARQYWAAQGALVTIAVAAEVARRRIATAEQQDDLADGVRLAVALPISMLAAWGAAASAMLVGTGKVPPGRPARLAGVVLTITTAATAIAAATSTPGGASTTAGRVYLSTVAWALGGIVAGQGRRNPAVAASAAAGLVPVVLTLTGSPGAGWRYLLKRRA